MELIAQKREKTGKVSKSLGYKGLIPAVIFGKGLESTNITVVRNDFIRTFNQAGETSLIDIVIDGNKPEKVLVREVSYNPVTDAVIHIGFYKPNLKEKTRAFIPVHVEGADKHPLVKSGNAVILTLVSEIEVEALPMNLPHDFTVDITKLEKIGDGITVSQLDYDKSKVEIVDLDAEDLVLKLDYAHSLETAEDTVTEEEALSKIEATKEKPKEEGTETKEVKKEAKK
jgi:large subunit ribosomal protein L25